MRAALAFHHAAPARGLIHVFRFVENIQDHISTTAKKMPTTFSAAGKYPKKPNENNSPYEVVQHKYTAIVDFFKKHFLLIYYRLLGLSLVLPVLPVWMEEEIYS